MRAVAAAAAVSFVLAGPAGAAAAPPVTVAVSASPAVAFFGDPIAVDVHVLGDVDPSSVRLEADSAPLERIGGVRRDEVDGDVHFRFTVACAAADCLGADALVHVKPAAMRVVAGGSTVRRAWPRIDIARRVAPAALTGQPRFRVDDGLAPVGWSNAPGRLVSVLLALALACGAAAAAIGVAEVLRRRTRVADRADALARALAELRAAVRGDERERRRAAGRVARVVAPFDSALATGAAQLAWSAAPPQADELEALAARVVEAAR